MADLLTLTEARESFAATEPLASAAFVVDPDLAEDKRPYVTVEDAWRTHGEDIAPTKAVECWLTVPELDGQRFQLTYQAARQLGSTCRQPQDLQVSHPADLHQVIINWWLARGLGVRKIKLLLSPYQGEGPDGEKVPLVVAQTRDTVVPFSNLALLDEVLKVLAHRYGREAAEKALVHFAMNHDLEHTDCTVVVPQAAQDIAGELWVPGAQFTNSCIGLKQTTVTGALMVADSAGVALDGAHSAGGFKRKNSAPEDAYEWAAESTNDVLGALDIAWGNVAELTHMPVGIQPGTFVESLCSEFKVPKAQMQRLTAVLEEWPGELTMASLVQITTRCANMEDLPWRTVAQLQEMAGHIIHSEGGRCSKDKPCYRAYPQGFESYA